MLGTARPDYPNTRDFLKMSRGQMSSTQRICKQITCKNHCPAEGYAGYAWICRICRSWFSHWRRFCDSQFCSKSWPDNRHSNGSFQMGSLSTRKPEYVGILPLWLECLTGIDIEACCDHLSRTLEKSLDDFGAKRSHKIEKGPLSGNRKPRKHRKHRKHRLDFGV